MTDFWKSRILRLVFPKSVCNVAVISVVKILSIFTSSGGEYPFLIGRASHGSSCREQCVLETRHQWYPQSNIQGFKKKKKMLKNRMIITCLLAPPKNKYIYKRCVPVIPSWASVKSADLHITLWSVWLPKLRGSRLLNSCKFKISVFSIRLFCLLASFFAFDYQTLPYY